MKKFLLIACLLTGSFLSNAQDSKWSISFSPAIVQSPDLHYAFQPGVAYEFNDRFSLLTEFAFVANNKSAYYSDGRYFRIKPELRYNLSESKRGLRAYMGFQASYSFRSWQDHGGCYHENNRYSDTVISFDGAKVNSPILTWSFQFGTPFSLTRRLDMDIFLGLGMRMIFTNYTDVQNAVKDPYFRPSCKIFPAPDAAYFVDGTVMRFHSNFGIRFLYRL